MILEFTTKKSIPSKRTYLGWSLYMRNYFKFMCERGSFKEGLRVNEYDTCAPVVEDIPKGVTDPIERELEEEDLGYAEPGVGRYTEPIRDVESENEGMACFMTSDTIYTKSRDDDTDMVAEEEPNRVNC